MRRKQSEPGSADGPTPESQAFFLPFLTFVLLSFLLYGNTLSNAFVHDDKPLVAENRLIREPGGLGRIFSSGYWTTGDQSVPELYRPVAVATLALNHFLGGANPIGYHLINILLHACVCALVYGLALELSAGTAVAWAGALLFAVHPVHTEAVAPVVGRTEILAAGFFLSALLLDRIAQRRTARRYRFLAGASLCYLAALFSKENAVAFPAVLLLTDLVLPSGGDYRQVLRRRSWEYGLYLSATVVYLGARYAVLGGIVRSITKPIDNPILAADSWTGFLTALIAAGKYVGLLLWPLHLSADYSRDQIPLATGLFDPRLLLSFLLLAAGVVGVVWGWRRSRWVAWSVLFYAVTMLPASNILIPIGTLFAERLVYLPSVGFCLLGGLAFAAIRGRQAAAASALLGVVLVFGSARTIARNRIWHDDGVFAVATAVDAPRSAKAQHNLGAYLQDHGDLAGAEKAYRRASELAPDWADTFSNRAGVLVRMGHSEEAISEYRRAIALRPDVIRFRVNLGYALYQDRKFEEAVSLYREALGAFGDSAPLWTNLGASLMALERFPEAVEAYRKAVGLEPSNPDYYLNLGQALAKTGEIDRSVAALRKGISFRPNAANLRSALGLVLLEKGDATQALAPLRAAARLDPGNAFHHYNLARACKEAGDVGTALAEYRSALRITPDAAPALRELGLLLARRGENREAGDLLRRAAALTPGGLDADARRVLERLP
ncbi:MAG TPA: tetratricopeptide repeat protein [Candidatus Polarisedimenticolia bacterium]|nr:tetratricopeptide repeat protein [Candidatus Polarisedimenticolia bacterium]